MPIYAYRCSNCGHAQDALQKLSDPVLTVCPACGQPTYVKQVTAAGFQLKGSGWYVTDFRGDGKGGKPAEADGGKDADKGGEKPAEAKGAEPASKGESNKGESNKSESKNGEGSKPAERAPAAAPAPAAASPAPAAAPPTGPSGKTGG